jgi:hypothetical protein
MSVGLIVARECARRPTGGVCRTRPGERREGRGPRVSVRTGYATPVSAKQRADPTTRTVQAGILAWLLPGAGHYFLGHRGIAIVFFVAISFAYGTGLAIGGVKNSVNPNVNHWLFLAEVPAGGYTIASYFLSNSLPTYAADELSPYVSFYPESDIAQIYLAVGGLLNLLAILDALTRAQTGGLPVFFHEMLPDGETSGEAKT